MISNHYLFLRISFSIFIILNAFSLYGYGQETDCKNQKSQEEKEDIKKPDEVKKTESKKPPEDKKQDEKPDEAKEETPKEVAPPRIGMFSLPVSQQPAALFGFGGNIIDKNEVQLFFFADEFIGKKKIVTDLIPGVLFGVTDNFTIFFNFPFTPIMRDGRNRSSGLEDFFIQLEYGIYSKKTFCYEDQATIVGNITFPTGSVKKNPPTGFGSPSLFLGGTFYRTYIDWIWFTEHGAVLTTSEHGTKIGDQFLYQFGFGRTISTPPGYIFAWLFEIDGQYNKRNRIKGVIDPNSGGNTIYVTPSLWISSKEFIWQFGVSFPVNQNLFGKQRKIAYAFNFNFGWSFY